MDERRLRYFLAVAEEGGVTRAAERLQIAQPSLSQALRAFEAELGVELFHRVGRGMRLSSAGDQLVGPARQVLRAMDDARHAIAGATELRSGTLELATLATLAVDPMASLIGRFRDRYPGVEVDVYEPETAAGVSALVREGACELGAAHLPIPAEGLIERPLGEQELLFVMPPQRGRKGKSSQSGAGKADRGASERPLRARELAEIPLVVAPRGTSTRMLLDQALEAVGVMPRIAVETAAREAIVPLVLSGAGAALLPAPLARDAQRRGAIVRPSAPRIARRIGLVHRDGPLSAAARAFLAVAG